MPELKRVFSKGRMNKDLDERVVPNGEYRDANNIEVTTSEGSEVGTVQSVYGNIEKTKLSTTAGFPDYYLSHHTPSNISTSSLGSFAECVASITDEKNNKIYSFIKDGLWFVNGSSIDDTDYLAISSDYILEYDIASRLDHPYQMKYVFNDIYKVQTKISEQCGQGVVGSSGFELRVTSNQGIRSGMVCSFIDPTGVQHTTKVKHIFTDNAGSTTYSTNRIYLEDEYTTSNLDTSVVLTFEAPRVLNFGKHDTAQVANKVTGINIIDDLLFWTDNNTEPKKISISRSIAGTGSTFYGADYFLDDIYQGPQGFEGSSRLYHTRLYATLNQKNGIELIKNDDETKPVYVDESHITVIRKAPTTPPILKMSSVGFDRLDINGDEHTVYAMKSLPMVKGSDTTGSYVETTDVLTVGDEIQVSFLDLLDWRDGDIIIATSKEPNNPTFFSPYEVRFKVLGQSSFNNPAGAVDGGSIPITLQAGFDLQVISIDENVTNTNQKWWFALERPKPLFEFKFPRFAYRYKYTDGEYSPFSPWSEIAFLPGPYNYKPNEGYNLGMTNQLRALKIKDYIVDTDYRPRDISEIDILYKEDGAPNVYTVKTIKRQDPGDAWPDLTIPENKEKRGEIDIEDEHIHAAVPSNQSIRAYDNVPRVALAQEITGNRLIYGNYLQNYNLETTTTTVLPEFEISIVSKELDVYDAEFSTNLSVQGYSFPVTIQTMSGAEAKPTKSVKSLRTYQLGVVYSDQYGRETPVLTNAHQSGGSIKVEKELSDKKNCLKVEMKSDPPSWATHYKYYIKETSSEYYNLALDRWYDAEDGNAWLSFPSSERNKVDLETFLILKKAHDSSTIIKEKARYKILAIESEAPDFIKINKQILGLLSSTHVKDAGYPLVDQDFIHVDAEAIHVAYGQDIDSELSDLDKYVDDNQLFYRVQSTTGLNSKWIKVIKMSLIAADPNNTTDWYYEFKLDNPIDEDITGITTSDGTLAGKTTHNIQFKREVVEDRPEFDGRFFVKIVRDLILDKNVLIKNTSTKYIVKETKHVGHVKRYIDFGSAPNGSHRYDGNQSHNQSATIRSQGGEFSKFVVGSPPDDYVYWNHTDGFPGHLALENWPNCTDDKDNSEAGLDGRGGYIGTPYDGNQGTDNGVSPIVPGGFDVSGVHVFNDGNKNNNFFTLDNNNARQNTKTFFDGISNSWNIDNCGAGRGGAGRGIHVDGQGTTPKNIQFNSNGTVSTATRYSNNDFINANCRVLNKNSDEGLFYLKDKNANTTLANGVGYRTYVGRDSDSGNTVANVPPSDTWYGFDNGLRCNVMHLSLFGVDGDDSEIDIKHGTEHYEFAQYLIKGTLFRWSEDPDKQVYEIIRVEKQTGIKNYQVQSGGSGRKDYANASNKRVRYTIKFKPIGHENEENPPGFGDETPMRFNPIVNAVDASGDPVTGPNGVVKQNATSDSRPHSFAGLDHKGRNSLSLQIIEAYEHDESEDKLQSNNPAIFETEPKDKEGLDIYYEISPSYPFVVTDETNEMLLPIGSYFTLSSKGKSNKYSITKWTSGQTFTITPEIDRVYETEIVDEQPLEIYTPYGGVIQVVVNGAVAAGDTSITIYGGPDDAQHNQYNKYIILPFWNCIAFGNGVESDRIRDDFNQPTVDNGVKASTTIAEPYKEERRKYGLIYSGLYNSTAGLNNLNQFIAGEKITKDLNPEYGSIQKLHTRDTNLLTLCEDKILKVQANKDALFNADGNVNVTSTNKFLGNAIAIPGEFGISKNPESFANYADMCYFSDKSRGAIMQLKGDALIPISQFGMTDYFSDNLKPFDIFSVLGTYDEKKLDYNVTITKGERFIIESQSTITWSERSKGWSSFKTFYPEQGLSINNEYYTWKSGSMWQHHSDAVARSKFYGTSTASGTYPSVTTIFNDNPSSVKSFNTIHYEGSQGRIVENDSDNEFYNLDPEEGWYCESITSDLQEGEVLEFIKKEGKWFNIIHGVATTLTNLDTSEFSVQGIGQASTVLHDGVANTLTLAIQDTGNTTLTDAIVDEGTTLTSRNELADTDVTRSTTEVTADSEISGNATITLSPSNPGTKDAIQVLYDNIKINDIIGTKDTVNGTVTFDSTVGFSDTNISSIVLSQVGDNVVATLSLQGKINNQITNSDGTTTNSTNSTQYTQLDFDYIDADKKTREIPFAASTYWPSSAIKNPRDKSFANFGNMTVTSSDVDGSRLGTTDITETSIAASPFIESSDFQLHTANLPHSTETLIFSKTFTANTDYLLKKTRGQNSYIIKDIVTFQPNKRNNPRIQEQSFDTQNVEDSYNKRWRFAETLTRDSDRNVTAVKVDGYYTTPDWRSGDARLVDGKITTLDDEKRKNISIMFTPNIKAKAPTISKEVNSVVYNVKERLGNDEDGIISIIPKKGQRVEATISGTPAAGGTINIQARYSTDFKPKSKAFTLDSEGSAIVEFKVPPQSVPSGITEEQYRVHIVPDSETTLGSGVPSATSRDILYQYSDVTISTQFTQAASLYTITPTNGSAGDATTIVKAPAFTDFATDDETVLATSTGAAGTYHRNVPNRKQIGERLYAIEVTIASADASKVSLDSTIKGTGTDGYITDFAVTNGNEATNGGTGAAIKELHARESGNDVILSGYVAMKRAGNETKTLQIPIDDMIST